MNSEILMSKVQNENPLLEKILDSTLMRVQQVDVNHEERSYKKLFCELLANMIPTMVYMASLFIGYSAGLHYIGKYYNYYLLDAIGISNTFMNCTTIALFLSLNIGLVSISAQAFGAKDYKLVGLYLHRGFLVDSIVLSVCFVFLAFSGHVLSIFGLPQITIDYGTTYIWYSFGYMVIMMIFDLLKSYLMAQNIYFPSMIIQLGVCISQWALAYLLVDYFRLDILGLCIALTISEAFGVLFILIYIMKFNPTPETWFWFRKESFQGLWDLFKSEFPIGTIMYLEWIVYELILIFSGSYPANQMAALVIICTVMGIYYNIPTSLSITLNCMVSNAMGEKDIIKAKRIFHIVVGLSIVVIVFMELVLYYFIDDIIGFYTSEMDIIIISHDIINLYFLILPADCFQYVIGGYIRGIGQEKISSLCFFICYYAIGLPLAFYFGNILQYEDLGLWYGLGIAIFLLFITCIWIILRTNLDKQVKEISNRIAEDQKKLDEIKDRSMFHSIF